MLKRRPGPQRATTREATRSPLVVTLDGQGRLVDMVGDPAAFGSMAREDIGWYLFDLTVGNAAAAEVLQSVELADGLFADIHIVSEDELKHFVLMDASGLVRSLQRNQQVANDATLRQERASKDLERGIPPVDRQSHQRQSIPIRRGVGLFSTLVAEMREPVALMSGHASILARHCHNDPVALRSIAMLMHAAVRLDALSSNGLVAMGECSTDAAGAGIVDLRRLGGFLLDLFSLQAEGLGITLTIRVPEERATVEIDDHGLRQTLINLITHALGGMEQGQLELSMSAGSRCLEVEINAEPSGFRNALFGPLVTTTDLLQSNSAGSLALAVSQQILRRMDATIELVPRKEGGCAVWFRLPAHLHGHPEGTCA